MIHIDTPMTNDRVVIFDGNPWVNAPFARSLERELNAATSEIERLTAKVAQLYEGAEEQKQRIKRLEDAGDELLAALQDDLSEYIEWINESTDAVGKWKRAKEDKP